MCLCSCMAYGDSSRAYRGVRTSRPCPAGGMAALGFHLWTASCGSWHPLGTPPTAAGNVWPGLQSGEASCSEKLCARAYICRAADHQGYVHRGARCGGENPVRLGEVKLKGAARLCRAQSERAHLRRGVTYIKQARLCQGHGRIEKPWGMGWDSERPIQRLWWRGCPRVAVEP